LTGAAIVTHAQTTPFIRLKNLISDSGTLNNATPTSE
jgi:hypothetical protein